MLSAGLLLIKIDSAGEDRSRFGALSVFAYIELYRFFKEILLGLCFPSVARISTFAATVTILGILT